MSKIAVIGAGIAGTSAAVELARAGQEVLILEKASEPGGKVKNFGCKADEVCSQCNLCLVDDILMEARDSSNIEFSYNTIINDCWGKKGDYTLNVEKEGKLEQITGIDTVVLATGYTKWSELETGTPELYRDERIIWSSELEDVLENRLDHINEERPIAIEDVPESVVFIQCNGSRNIQEKAPYCSRICCGYNYRLARVLKHFYPEIDITMFFMDIQEAGYLTNVTFDKLTEAGINYINCKPIRVEREQDDLTIIYEDQKTGKVEEMPLDLLVLSEGIHASEVNEKWSRLFNLQLDRYGFLYPIEDERKTGIYLAGTIKGPDDIAGTISDSKNVAYRIINSKRKILKSGG